MEPPKTPEVQGRPQQSSHPKLVKVLLASLSVSPLSERTYACLFIAVSQCLTLTFNAH